MTEVPSSVGSIPSGGQWRTLASGTPRSRSHGGGWPALAHVTVPRSGAMLAHSAVTNSVPGSRSASAVLARRRIVIGSSAYSANSAIVARTYAARRAAVRPWPTTSPTTTSVLFSAPRVTRKKSPATSPSAGV